VGWQETTERPSRLAVFRLTMKLIAVAEGKAVEIVVSFSRITSKSRTARAPAAGGESNCFGDSLAIKTRDGSPTRVMCPSAESVVPISGQSKGPWPAPNELILGVSCGDCPSTPLCCWTV